MRDLIDRIVILGIGQRGVTGHYESVRPLASGPVFQARVGLTRYQPGGSIR